MASTLDISIPTTTTSTTSKPYTIYNINLRQPLRSYTVQKRYSDFQTLNSALVSQASSSEAPAPLPGKSWFKSTISSPELTEERRKGLEIYLRAINSSDDSRWRRTEAWRQFLNLPPGTNTGGAASKGLSGQSAAAASLTRNADHSQTPIVDPTVWLDVHRELKSQLADARQAIRRRTEASTAKVQHEAGADARRYLVRSGTTIAALEAGLQRLSEQSKPSRRHVNEKKEEDDDLWTPPSVGEGEIRRRRDLLSSAKKERDSLEVQLTAFATSTSVADSSSAAMATPAQKNSLLQGPGAASSSPTSSSPRLGAGSVSTNRRVLGGKQLKETERTRELDNEGVLQLQKQIMQEQDEDADQLTHTVRRMREMGMQINQELVYQNEMLGLFDQDVDRVADKIKIAKKRVSEIK